jgi:hypothetical protein
LPGFVRRLHRYYDSVRLLTAVHHRLRLLAFPMRAPDNALASSVVSREISQFPYKELLRMPGSTTTPGRAGARSSAPVRVAFRFEQSVGTRDQTIFAAQWLAYVLPYRRFADVLAHAHARLGADVVCYSFIAVDLHHLLLASLPGARSISPEGVIRGCCRRFA